MIPVSPVTIHIEGLNDNNAQAILDTFIKNLGPVKHTDAISFFRDLQPVCRELKTKARLVPGIQTDIIDNTTEEDTANHHEKYTFIITNTDSEKHPINCVLALCRDVNELFYIGKVCIFVPDEYSIKDKDIRIDLEFEEHDEFDDDFDDDEETEEGGAADDAEPAAAAESDDQ
jgi:hypothetical protein